MTLSLTVTKDTMEADARERVINRIVAKQIEYNGHPITKEEAESIIVHKHTVLSDESASVTFDFKGINWWGRAEYMHALNTPEGEYTAFRAMVN